ncbi:MAG TPA: iron chelate uptake ABC transporter family permease subunit [Dehalococcoidia bacterium]
MSQEPTAPPVARRAGLRWIQAGPVAFLVNVRTLALAAAVLAGVTALATWGLTLGSFPLPLGDVVRSLAGAGPAGAEFIVLDLRLPRILTAVLVGALLALSGALFQGLVRNPLVSPDVIGINAGASAAAVFWIVTGRAPSLLPAVAFVGALGAAAAVYLLSWRGRVSPPQLVLVGIGVNALLTACTTFLLLRAEIHEASRAVLWMTGSVYASDWGEVRRLAAALAVLGPVAVGLARPLRLMHTGDLTARSLGLALERTRLALVVAGCGLSAFAVSVAGPVGFVALVAPHLARMLAGPVSGGVMVLAGTLGAALLLGADLAGQHALPVGLPAGVLTAAVGAPYFLFLLYRTNARL